MIKVDTEIGQYKIDDYFNIQADNETILKLFNELSEPFPTPDEGAPEYAMYMRMKSFLLESKVINFDYMVNKSVLY